MEQLVFKTDKNTLATTSKLVAIKFEKRHADVIRAIELLECSDEFRQRNFALTLEIKQMPRGASRKDKQYIITRDGFTFLAMGFTGKHAAKFKEDYISAFNAMEELLLNPFNVPKTFSDALALAAKQQKQIEEQQNKINKLEPRAEFAEDVANTVNTDSVGVFAKEIGWGQNKLFEFLRDQNILMHDNVPYQKYINAGYFKVKLALVRRTNGNEMKPTTRITGKGKIWLFSEFFRKSDGAQLALPFNPNIHNIVIALNEPPYNLDRIMPKSRGGQKLC